MTKSYSQQKMFIDKVLEVDNLVFKPQSELKNPKYKKIELFDAESFRILFCHPTN